MHLNKFIIIVPSFNNEEWIETNLASILNQTYENYRVIYIDDASTDETYNTVCNIVGDLSNWEIIRNKENKGAAYNYIEPVRHLFPKDDEIIIHLDGDDWLFDENVLEKLNDFYNKTECWMTYGQFVCWDGTDNVTQSFPQGTPYDDFIHRHKFYRRDQWRASHLRTYKYSLWKSIDREDLKSKIDGEYYWHASDLAWAFPALEMCPKDKIGVVDFTTHVYNATPKNQERTKEREAADNSKFEDEIRNKKIYREGIGQGKLPQINVYYDYLEYTNIPKKFSYCYKQEDGEYDMVFVGDMEIIDYLYGVIESPKGVKVIARICENRNFFNQQTVIDAVLAFPNRFDLILTWDEEILKLPNAVFCPLTETTQFNTLPTELPEDAFQIYSKSKLVSAISSTKSMVPGHTTRLQFIDSIKDRVDLFGRGIKEIPSKLDGLKDYMFSVAIENATDINYFTEKLTDCLVTGTIPVYYGCPNVGDFFDMNGIITFNSMEELHQILDSLTPELYQSKLDSARKNFELAFNYPTDNNSMYKLYYKQYEH